ncbi:MAG: solute carrier family 39 (zinc transporter), member 7 [Parcubacteria bacterium C7867-001]|nr:MAG: solute carrier family 39 (zinc transporter), member 7 [Parcubacteria bacterium C7867-001]
MYTLPVIGIALAACLATFIGGSIALKLKNKIHLVLGFSAGAVVAVALFDLLPEAIELGEGFFSTTTLLLWAAIGFFAYLVLDRTIIMHTHHDDGHDHEKRGKLGAGTLSLHSFIDGLAIGVAFQASVPVGLVVAAAVLTHDFSDGINTVNLILKNGGTRKEAMRWLILDSLAPVLGVLSTLFFTLPQEWLALVLATFAGFFLYIGASDLIPESHHAHPKFLTTIMTLLGAAVLYVVVRIAGV